MQKLEAAQQRQYKVMPLMALRGWVLACALLAGCASPPQVPVEEQISLKTVQWADALIAQDYQLALTFMTPSYRSSPRAERFRADFAGASFWQSAEIKWVKCDEDNTLVAGSDDDSGDDSKAVIAELAGAGEATSNENSRESADDCRVTSWEDCGHQRVTTPSVSSAVSTSSGRCQVRLMLMVMKPPEMPYPTRIPFEVTWLNISESWYVYH